MNIVIIGYGKMGKNIETLAKGMGFNVVDIIDKHNSNQLLSLKNKNIDIAFEFSEPCIAENNCLMCLQQGISVVCGTTGWEIPYSKIKILCESQHVAFFHSTNFSLGTWMFFRLSEWFATQMKKFDYSVSISETHHIHKKDKPSGTAITLAQHIIKGNPSFKEWKLTHNAEMEKNIIDIESIREGEVVGIHSATWKSEFDSISISHTMKNRALLAKGAIDAALFIYKKKGMYTMNDILDSLNVENDN